MRAGPSSPGTAAAAVLAVLTLGAAGCADLDVANLNQPDRNRAVATPGDVEALISGGFASWWGGNHYNGPGGALTVAADAGSSSWLNFGMRDSGQEPRQAYRNDPSYEYAYVTEAPWALLYRSLAGVRDGLLAIESGVRIGVNGDDTHRALAFGRFVQGLAHGTLALVFDQAFIVDETTDLEVVGFRPYPEVMAAALGYLDEAIALVQQEQFTIPAIWMSSPTGDVTAVQMRRLAQSYKARFMASVARTPAERQAVDWRAVIQAAQSGTAQDFEVEYNGSNWGWDRLKVHIGAEPTWMRYDIRMLGPAHAGSEWREWEATEPGRRQPFLIDTDDRRITGGTPTTAGKYVRHAGASPFPPERGSYHQSFYSDLRWRGIMAAEYVGRNGEFPVKELEFLIAEGRYRNGDRTGAMQTVNKYRANGELRQFTDPNGVAPGGGRCVPKTLAGACGDLWEALKYEKRMEVWHYGMGVEFFDDRGWGDLVPNTFTQLPVPGAELLLLLQDIYTFGGSAGGGGGRLTGPLERFRVDPERIRANREALERFDRMIQREFRVLGLH